MEFINDITRTRRAILDYIKDITIITVIGLITTFSTLYFVMQPTADDNLGLLGFIVSILGTIILFAIFWLCFYRNYKKWYLSYKIEVGDDIIQEKSRNIKIELNENCQITKDSRENVYMQNGKNEIVVSKYLKDKNKFENVLSSRYTISSKKEKHFSTIIFWLSHGFFTLILFSRFIPFLELYVFIATGFILTTIYDIIYLFITNINVKYRDFKLYTLVIITIRLILVYFVSQNLFTIFRYIIER